MPQIRLNTEEMPALKLSPFGLIDVGPKRAVFGDNNVIVLTAQVISDDCTFVYIICLLHLFSFLHYEHE